MFCGFPKSTEYSGLSRSVSKTNSMRPIGNGAFHRKKTEGAASAGSATHAFGSEVGRVIPLVSCSGPNRSNAGSKSIDRLRPSGPGKGRQNSNASTPIPGGGHCTAPDVTSARPRCASEATPVTIRLLDNTETIALARRQAKTYWGRPSIAAKSTRTSWSPAFGKSTVLQARTISGVKHPGSAAVRSSNCNCVGADARTRNVMMGTGPADIGRSIARDSRSCKAVPSDGNSLNCSRLDTVTVACVAKSSGSSSR